MERSLQPKRLLPERSHWQSKLTRQVGFAEFAEQVNNIPHGWRSGRGGACIPFSPEIWHVGNCFAGMLNLSLAPARIHTFHTGPCASAECTLSGELHLGTTCFPSLRMLVISRFMRRTRVSESPKSLGFYLNCYLNIRNLICQIKLPFIYSLYIYIYIFIFKAPAFGSPSPPGRAPGSLRGRGRRGGRGGARIFGRSRGRLLRWDQMGLSESWGYHILRVLITRILLFVVL